MLVADHVAKRIARAIGLRVRLGVYLGGVVGISFAVAILVAVGLVGYRAWTAFGVSTLDVRALWLAVRGEAPPQPVQDSGQVRAIEAPAATIERGASPAVSSAPGRIALRGELDAIEIDHQAAGDRACQLILEARDGNVELERATARGTGCPQEIVVRAGAGGLELRVDDGPAMAIAAGERLVLHGLPGEAREAPPPPPDPTDIPANIDRIATKVLADSGVPSAVVAAVFDGKVAYVHASARDDNCNGVFDDDDLFAGMTHRMRVSVARGTRGVAEAAPQRAEPAADPRARGWRRRRRTRCSGPELHTLDAALRTCSGNDVAPDRLVPAQQGLSVALRRCFCMSAPPADQLASKFGARSQMTLIDEFCVPAREAAAKPTTVTIEKITYYPAGCTCEDTESCTAPKVCRRDGWQVGAKCENDGSGCTGVCAP